LEAVAASVPAAAAAAAAGALLAAVEVPLPLLQGLVMLTEGPCCHPYQMACELLLSQHQQVQASQLLQVLLLLPQAMPGSLSQPYCTLASHHHLQQQQQLLPRLHLSCWGAVVQVLLLQHPGAAAAGLLLLLPLLLLPQAAARPSM
jgi:hypothetical protein